MTDDAKGTIPPSSMEGAESGTPNAQALPETVDQPAPAAASAQPESVREALAEIEGDATFQPLPATPPPRSFYACLAKDLFAAPASLAVHPWRCCSPWRSRWRYAYTASTGTRTNTPILTSAGSPWSLWTSLGPKT